MWLSPEIRRYFPNRYPEFFMQLTPLLSLVSTENRVLDPFACHITYCVKNRNNPTASPNYIQKRALFALAGLCSPLAPSCGFSPYPPRNMEVRVAIGLAMLYEASI